MRQIWAVARQMIAEGIRMKIALVFLVLIGMVVVGLPFSVSGDGSLTGTVQSFLSYGFTATGFLLGMLTIFMSRSLSDEFVHRHAFLVVTKPIARWRFVVGKWLGICCLDGVFLLAAGVIISAMTFYIHTTHPPIDNRYDEKELTEEVLVARHALRCVLPDFAPPAEAEFQKNLELGFYDDVPNFVPDNEKSRLLTKHEARWRVVPPMDVRVFTFENVLCDRSPEASIQIRYKTLVSQFPPDEIFRAIWRFGDPFKGTPVSDRPVRHAVDRYHTVTAPADAVADDQTLTVHFYNQNPYEGERTYNNFIEFRASDDVEVLFVVGSFYGNVVRLLALMMCKLMFLAAVAVLMTCVFSFPVACLTSFTVYVLAGARAFLLQAFDFASDDTASMFDSAKEFFIQSVMHLYDMIHWVIPDFGYYDGVESLVNGRNVGLVWVLQAVGELAILKTGVVLGLAVLLFYRREVAEISV